MVEPRRNANVRPDSRSVRRTCHLCEAGCGLRLEVEGDRIASVRGDQDDPFSSGYCCPKGLAIGALHDDPDRLRRPLVRGNGGALLETSWEEALGVAADGFARAIARYGRHAFARYVGNPVVHNLGALLGSEVVGMLLPTKNRYSANSQDANPHLVANRLMFGAQLLHPVADLPRVQDLLVLGANPAASNGSLMTAAGVLGRLRAIRDRGGRVVVIDPRRTRTASLASEHHFIRPGMDGALLLAMVETVLAEGLADADFLARSASNLDRLRAAVRPFTADTVAPSLGSGWSAERIRGLARWIARSPAGFVYGRLGLCLSRFAGVSAWALNVLNAVTGSLDRPGAGVFAQGPAEHLVRSHFGRGSFDRYRSPQGAPEVNGEYPGHILADQIERGRADPEATQAIHAMLLIAGNPVLSAPNGPRVARALRSLDHLVAVDVYRSETANLAHVVLPPRSSLYDLHFPFVFSQLAVERFVRASAPVLAPPPNRPSDFEILQRLAVATFDRLPASGRPWRRRLLAQAARRLSAERIADLLLRSGPLGEGFLPAGRGPMLARLLSMSRGLPAARHATQVLPRLLSSAARRLGAGRITDLLHRGASLGKSLLPSREGLTLARLLAMPHGLPVTAHATGVLSELLATRDHRIDLAPAPFVEDLPRLLAWVKAPAKDGSLTLIGRRHLRSNNSWFHNLPGLASRSRRCDLVVHPIDADRLGLGDGDPVEVRSEAGALTAPVRRSDEMAPGVVSLPHGWGHATHGGRVARENAGVSANDVTSDLAVDPLTGNAALNHVAVQVRALTPAKLGASSA